MLSDGPSTYGYAGQAPLVETDEEGLNGNRRSPPLAAPSAAISLAQPIGPTASTIQAYSAPVQASFRRQQALSNRINGRNYEDHVRVVCNLAEPAYIIVNGRISRRRPDGVSESGIQEVKSGNHLNFTHQLRDMLS